MNKHIMTHDEMLAEIASYKEQGKSPLLLSQKYLYQPFYPDVHSQVFIAYCECVILPNGKIVYAIPSHNEALIYCYSVKNHMTRDEVVDKFRNNIDAYAEMMRDTRVVQVWYEHIHNATPLTKAQNEAISLLLEYGCIDTRAVDDIQLF